MRIRPDKPFEPRECPSCACSVPGNHNRCPVCGYDFPQAGPVRKGLRWAGAALMLLLLALLLLGGW